MNATSFSSGRERDVGNGSGGAEESPPELARGIADLKRARRAFVLDDRDEAPLLRPVGPSGVLEKGPGLSAERRPPGQRSVRVDGGPRTAEQDEDLGAVLGEGHRQLRFRVETPVRTLRLRQRHIGARGSAVPGRRVEDRIGLLHEERARDDAAAKGQAAELRTRSGRAGPAEAAQSPSPGEDGGGGGEEAEPAAPRGRLVHRTLPRRPPRGAPGSPGSRAPGRVSTGTGRTPTWRDSARPPTAAAAAPRTESLDRLGLVVQYGRERVDARVSSECALSRRHLVEHGAERELVRAEVDRLPSRLLRRHVAGGADDFPGLRRRRRRVGDHVESVAPITAAARARPKSRIFTRPSRVTMTFAA